jgi:hypothetical protein
MGFGKKNVQDFGTVSSGSNHGMPARLWRVFRRPACRQAGQTVRLAEALTKRGQVSWNILSLR